MAVAYFTEFRADGRDLSEAPEKVSTYINERLQGKPPAGGIYHAEGPLDSGWWTFNVWESAEAADRFRAEYLTPALEHANAPKGQTRQLSVAWDTSQMQS
jgi:hypothetical protein